MKAVIMAGGEGTRLRPITLTRPKPLVPVAGEVCIDLVLGSLIRAGIGDVIITTGFRAAELIRHTGGGSRYGSLNIIYSIEDRPMGTAGGVKKMERFLDDTFIVASGDVLSEIDLGELMAFHRERDAEATMALTRVQDPTQFGIVGVDESGRILRFLEKPSRDEVFSDLINAGIYILEPSVLDLIPEATKFDFSRELFPLMLQQGRRLFATPISGFWKDIGDPFDLIGANLGVIEDRGGWMVHTPPGGFGDVSLTGPVMIGKDVVMGRGCAIRRAAVSPCVRFGSGCTVEDSVVMENVTVGAHCSIRHSVVGEGTVIHDGCTIEDTIVGDEQEIVEGSRLKGERIPAPGE